MNAYELADELKACIDDGSTDLVCVCGAVNMLRQLADELKACKIHDRRGWEYAEELEQERRKQADRIAELEKEKDRLEKLVHQRFDDGKRLGTIETEDRLLKQSEPFAWFDGEHYVCPEIGYEYTITTEHPKALGWKPLYTTPQTKPLSDEEIYSLLDKCIKYTDDHDHAEFMYKKFARAIEERHGIK